MTTWWLAPESNKVKLLSRADSGFAIRAVLAHVEPNSAPQRRALKGMRALVREFRFLDPTRSPPERAAPPEQLGGLTCPLTLSPCLSLAFEATGSVGGLMLTI